MEPETTEWLAAPEAAERFKLNYNFLRALVNKGVFTRGVFGPAQVRPPIYLRVVELEAYRSGGVPAVAPVKAAYDASLKAPTDTVGA